MSLCAAVLIPFFGLLAAACLIGIIVQLVEHFGRKR